MSEKRWAIPLVICLFLGIFGCKSSKIEEPKANSPPVITAVNIFPESPTHEKDLGITVEARDPDQDSITYHHQWIKNEAEIIGENRNVLKSGAFKKGDMIQVRVTPSDGKVDGTPFISTPVRILNSPPNIQEVRIEPRISTAKDNLKAIVKAVDPDGDFIYFDYKWEKNGMVLPEESKEILERTRFKKGDSIKAIVAPNDGEVMGIPKKSDLVVISNSAPIIVSSPPASIEGTTYRYQVKTDDPDYDPVTFTLKSGPQGMEINKKTGLIRWDVQQEKKGTYAIEIEAVDSEGARSSQRFTISVDIKEAQ